MFVHRIGYGFHVFETGDYNKVPVILGSDKSEFSIFAAQDPLFVKAFFGGTIATDAALLKQYQFANKYGSMLYAGFNADQSAEKLAEVKNQPNVYAFRFVWGEDQSVISPGMGSLVGAFHGIHMDFITGREDSFVTTNYTEANKMGRTDLTATVQHYLKNFMYTGNPNSKGLTEWKTWSNAKGAPKLMVLDANKEKAVVGMTKEYINESDVFKAIDEDTSISQNEKTKMLSTVMSGRFFSTSLDARYNQ
ncbi:carboxylesterase family protein [Paenibacillus glycanilyticus]|uniref:Carboxylesterase type B domain-containing protein n=1 Tax=Paenibacillus glycanilyticus TaxID=126569 RepID=A0ABQ6GCD3_9BACL|nr:carboxylesterase family protein [Paenibacillus glycanilyticus]GLX68175.1 hypothetical protein MU1_25200 [Paenibacillus glycanilyticus]